MADQKLSGLPTDSSYDGNHSVPITDPVGPKTGKASLANLAAWFFNQANIPGGAGSPITRDAESMQNFVSSGLVITGDAYGSTRAASMTSGIAYINGRRISIAAVVARVYTASRDTYVDALDNTDGTATLVYTEVTNGAAAPALAANSIRIGKVITGATNIAAAGSIQQVGRDSLYNWYYPKAVPLAQILTGMGAPGGDKKYIRIGGTLIQWQVISFSLSTGASAFSGNWDIPFNQLTAAFVSVITGWAMNTYGGLEGATTTGVSGNYRSDAGTVPRTVTLYVFGIGT